MHPIRVRVVLVALLPVLACDGTTGPGPVPGPPALLRIELQDVRMAPGTTRQLTAIGHLRDGTSRDISSEVTWGSSYPAVVQVDTRGSATAGSPGEAFVSAIGQGQRATATVLVLPDGTWKVAGSVRDQDIRLEAATVTAIGNGTTVSSVTTRTGEYALYGVAGSVDIRAELTGYKPSIRPIVVSGDITVDLEMIADSPHLQGRYEMTVSATHCSKPIPDELRTRTYIADVEQHGNRLTVTLSGATFLRNRFTGTVVGDTVTFILSEGFYYFYYRGGNGYDVVELLDGGYLVVAGTAELTGTPGRLDGSLRGSFFHGQGAPSSSATYAGLFNGCDARAHSVRFVRVAGS